jgi:chemotaxis protein CheC
LQVSKQIHALIVGDWQTTEHPPRLGTDEIIARAPELKAPFVTKRSRTRLSARFVRRVASSAKGRKVSIGEGELSEIEQDALAEIANMAVARAASSLREMVGEQVLLSIPAVRIERRSVAADIVGQGAKLVAVQQSFAGPFACRALLIFPESHSLELVRSILGDQHSLDDIIDLEQEALAETGNVILNACLATIANVLGTTMRMSLPSVVRGSGADLFAVQEASAAGNLVIFLYIKFTTSTRNIDGFIALLMDLPSIETLKNIVDDFIKNVEQQSARSN